MARATELLHRSLDLMGAWEEVSGEEKAIGVGIASVKTWRQERASLRVVWAAGESTGQVR